MLDKVKELIVNEKDIIMFAVISLLVCVAIWGMFSGGIPDNGGAINSVRAELESTRAELAVANGKLAESQSISEELRRTNITIKSEIAELTRDNREIRELANSIGQINIELAKQINRDSDLTSENLKLVRESQRGFKVVRETGEVRN